MRAGFRPNQCDRRKGGDWLISCCKLGSSDQASRNDNTTHKLIAPKSVISDRLFLIAKLSGDQLFNSKRRLEHILVLIELDAL